MQDEIKTKIGCFIFYFKFVSSNFIQFVIGQYFFLPFAFVQKNHLVTNVHMHVHTKLSLLLK